MQHSSLAVIILISTFGFLMFFEIKITGQTAVSSLKWTLVDKCEKPLDATSSEFVYGEVTVEKKGKIYTYADACNKDKKKVGEYYCNKGKRIARKYFTCENGCEKGKCVKKTNKNLFDENGRLTNYALSLAPLKLELNLNELVKLYPEKYGDNYFEPGKYNIHVGDGFGKDNFLIKFVEFNIDEQRIYFEVFKKESNGNYYHFSTHEDSIYRNEIKDIFGISLESLSDSLNPVKNTLTYHPNCTVFYDYCGEAGNYFYADGSSISCNWRCAFDANTDEIKSQKGTFSSIYPKNYDVLANFSVALLEQCYNNTIAFMKYDPQKPRIGVKVLLGNPGPFTGFDEQVYTQKSVAQMKDEINILDFLNTEKKSKKCPNYMVLGHELTHTLTKEILGDNYGLNEGLADFVAFQNGFEKKYVCLDKGWKDVYDDAETINAYANLSTNPGEVGSPSSLHYYATGYCFWTDLVIEYGYPTFVKIMQQLYQQSRSTNDFYVLNIIEKVIKQPVSDEIVNRYSITKEATKIKLCHNCEIFT